MVIALQYNHYYHCYQYLSHYHSSVGTWNYESACVLRGDGASGARSDFFLETDRLSEKRLEHCRYATEKQNNDFIRIQSKSDKNGINFIGNMRGGKSIGGGSDKKYAYRYSQSYL